MIDDEAEQEFTHTCFDGWYPTHLWLTIGDGLFSALLTLPWNMAV